MKHLIYTIYDSQVESHSVPFFVPNAVMAHRYFETLVRDPKSDIARFPAAFNLMEIGSYDDSNASFELLNPPILAASASSYQEK